MFYFSTLFEYVNETYPFFFIYLLVKIERKSIHILITKFYVTEWEIAT